MNTRLPSLGSLLAFEAAAESGSFAKAANQLCVTPAAISQQVQSLEIHLGVKLFDRFKTGVKLTRAGQSYLVSVLGGLEKLRFAQQQIVQFNNLEILTITALPSVAQKWLMPLVLEWMDINPKIEVRVEASHARVSFNHSASDMCISFGDTGYSECFKDKLVQDSVSVVASPELVNRLAKPLDLKKVLELPMIHVDWGDDNCNLPQWQDWLDTTTSEPLSIQGGPRFNLSSMAIDAAVQGKGLLLGQQLLITQEIKSNKLVPLFSTGLPLGQAYYLIYPQRTLDNPNAKNLISWLKVQFEN